MASSRGFKSFLSLVLLGLALLSGCAGVKHAGRGQPESAPAAEASQTQAAPTQAKAEPRLRASRFDYEAERAAKEAGCSGPNGERPMARLDAREGAIERFTVQCAAQSMRVLCDMGMCRAQL